MKTIEHKKNKSTSIGIIMLFMLLSFNPNCPGQAVISATKTPDNLVQNNDVLENSIPDYIPSEFFSYYVSNEKTSSCYSLEGLINNGLKLDSICEYESVGWLYNLKKYYYRYENGKLDSKECVHFKSTYNDTLGTKELWGYNERGLLEKYRKLKAFESLNDTIILVNETSYVYEDGKIIKKHAKILDERLYEIEKRMGNETLTDILQYIEHTFLYNYSPDGVLTGKTDFYKSLFSVNVFKYDSEGRIKYFHKDSPFPQQVTKIFYNNTDTTKTILLVNTYENDSDIAMDTIGNWSVNSKYTYWLDQQGRDSIYQYESLDFLLGKLTVRSTSKLHYYPNNKLSSVDISACSFFIIDRFSQGHIEWLYFDDGRLLEYHLSYFDSRWNSWQTQLKLEYHYSSVKSIEIPLEEDETDSGIYPNPATTSINIGFSKQFTIFNLHGHLILSGKSNNGIVDVSGIMPGVYFIRLTGQGVNAVQRFIKK